MPELKYRVTKSSQFSQTVLQPAKALRFHYTRERFCGYVDRCGDACPSRSSPRPKGCHQAPKIKPGFQHSASLVSVNKSRAGNTSEEFVFRLVIRFKRWGEVACLN